VYQAIGSLVNEKSRDKVMDFERENRTDTSGGHSAICSDHNTKNVIFEDGRGRSKVGTPSLWVASDSFEDRHKICIVCDEKQKSRGCRPCYQGDEVARTFNSLET
jgi:hypothetical protein